MSQSKKTIEVLDPIDLKGKVQKVTRVEAREMLKRAKTVIDNLGEHYLDWAKEDFAQLTAAYEGARNDSDARNQHMDKIVFIAHDMKGQGTTFGYPLITEVCQSLCYFLDSADRDAPVTLDVIGAHVDTLSLLIRDNMEGDGGTAGQRLTDALSRAVAKFTA